MSLADLVTYAAGGITLPLAVYTVLQVLKRNHPAMAAYMVELVIVIALVLVTTAKWAPAVFLVIAGTFVLAAVILFAHGAVKHVAGPKGGGTSGPSG